MIIPEYMLRISQDEVSIIRRFKKTEFYENSIPNNSTYIIENKDTWEHHSNVDLLSL